MRESSPGEQPGLASDGDGVLEQMFGSQQKYYDEIVRRMNVLVTILRSEDANISDRLDEM
jgi:hypothetical protein